jgi:acyl-CoA synthetase (AMP-forming)/AMP-acid ligase II
MIKLLEKIKQNQHLLYIDPQTKNEYTISDLLLDDIKNPSNKELAFLYLDNSINSISALWSFYSKNYSIALLSQKLDNQFKKSLESIYKPSVIVDSSRDTINSYTKNSLSLFTFFSTIEKNKVTIANEIKVLLSTSGTTGSPKFVKLSDKNLYENALSILNYLPVKSSDVAPLNLSVFYSYGLSILTTNSISGGKIICTNTDILNKIFWDEFREYKFTSLAGVPFVYEMLERISFRNNKYPSLRYLTQAGGKLSSELIEKFGEFAKENEVDFFVMYGQTEASARMSFLAPKYIRVKSGSIGKPILNGNFSIDKETRELVYQGPNVFGGYCEGLADLESYDTNDILKTGDLAEVDNDGFYYIKGRIKRFVKITGTRINLDELETLLKKQFSDITLFCNGFQDKYILVGIYNLDFNKNVVIEYISKLLNVHGSLVKVFNIDKIPTTANGKINYDALTDYFDAKDN